MDLDWKNLSFGYIKTDYNIRSYFRDGAWTTPELTTDETVTMHMAATCLHYGQEAFEGQKAFRGADGVIRIFRPEENAKRMRSSAEYLKMALPPVDMFVDMMKRWLRPTNVSSLPTGRGRFAVYPPRTVRHRPAGRRKARRGIPADRFRYSGRSLL